MVVVYLLVALGQETTSLTTLPVFAHHGMIYVPFGFANAVSCNHCFFIGVIVSYSNLMM